MTNGPDLIKMTPFGLYCPWGDFYVDPSQPVKKAIITHGHADHARGGCGTYLTSEATGEILRRRFKTNIRLQVTPFGETVSIHGVKISLHPAGHILGSGQVRIEYKGAVWVISGDYKVEAGKGSEPFELVPCHTFITESTFGLPVFRWEPQNIIYHDINTWWEKNKEQGITTLVFAYALGKAQRLMAGLDASIGPLFTHGAVENMTQCYRNLGIDLPQTRHITEATNKTQYKGALVIAPPSANTPRWTKKFKDIATAFASGWMLIRGHRRRRAVDRGFAFSDHADWTGLVDTIFATGAETVWVTHGYAAELVRWLQDKGLKAKAVPPQHVADIEGSLGSDTGDS